jgi:hypothetical protein
MRKVLGKILCGKKYLNNSFVYLAKHKTHDSALWSDMLHVKDIYLSGDL